MSLLTLFFEWVRPGAGSRSGESGLYDRMLVDRWGDTAVDVHLDSHVLGDSWLRLPTQRQSLRGDSTLKGLKHWNERIGAPVDVQSIVPNATSWGSDGVSESDWEMGDSEQHDWAERTAIGKPDWTV